MRVLLVSRNTGPMKNLARVAQALSDRNHEVVAVLSNSPEVMVYAPALMGFQPQVVVTSLSTTPQTISDELAVIVQAKEKGVPFAVFADTYGAHNRPEMPAELKKATSVVLVPDTAEKKFAESVGYPRAEAVGVPLWEDFADEANYPSREVTRKELGIGDGVVAVMPAFGKNGELNRELFRDTLTAIGYAAKRAGRHNYVLLPRFHPGDEAYKKDRGYYDSVLAESPVRVIGTPAYNQSDDLVPAVDIVVSQLSTVAISAIYQRKLVIEYAPPAVLDRLEKQTGRRSWPTTETGAAAQAHNVDELAAAIEWLWLKLPMPENPAFWAHHSEEGDTLAQALWRAQIRHYPEKKGYAAKRIVEVLESLVR